MHTKLYQKTTAMHVWGCSSPVFWITQATLNHKSNVSDSRAVIQYVEHPYIYAQNGISERDCDVCLEP